MKKGGSKLFIFAGVALALVAVVLGIASFSGGGKTGAQDKARTKVTVVEAVKDVPAHTVITATDVIEKQVASTVVTDGLVTSAGSVIGQSYSVPLVTGQRLQTALVEVPGLANVIKPGLRAMSLPITSVSALGGLVQDGDYVDIVFHARINLERIVNSTLGNLPEDGDFKADKPSALGPSDPVLYPAAGDAGSIFQVRDGVGEDGQMEPVAKIVLQDLHVLRVLGPGESFNRDGSISAPIVDATSGSQDSKLGQLIIEVTPQQAELVTFIQDAKQQYQVVVRAKDDHGQVSTTGITYEILVDSATWALPYPKSVTSPAGTPTVQKTPAQGSKANGSNGTGGSLSGGNGNGNGGNGSSGGGNGSGV